MPKIERVLKVFLASPTDVGEERYYVDAFVTEWNDLWSDELGVYVKLLRWETHAYPAIGRDGQDVINEQIGEKYDLFVGIMWNRFGTPTKRAASGTVEEYERALNRHRVTGEPQLLLYFKQGRPPNEAVEETQIRAVQDFRRTVAKDGLLYWEFEASEQFGKLVRIHLTRHIQNWSKRFPYRFDVEHPDYRGLLSRYAEYTASVKRGSSLLADLCVRFASTLSQHLSQNKRRAKQVRSMSDEELTFEFMKRSTLEITAALMSFAEQTERFEANYEQAFSNFIENILGLAAISIAVPHTKVDCVSNDIGKLRTQLRENSKAMDGYVKGLHETQPRLSGVMLSANKRSIEALSKFIEHCDFGERMLREAEKLFDVGLKLGKR